jgi:hypothetical protein
MLALEAAKHISFAHTALRKQPGLQLWQIFVKDEKNFMRMLTRGAIYGMIAVE